MQRITAFFVLCAFTLALYFIPLKALVQLAFQNDAYSYILLTPFISAFFVFQMRKTLVPDVRYSMARGSILIGFAVVTRFLPFLPGLGFLADPPGTWMTASMIIFFVGGCVALFGGRVVLQARFPLVLLVVFGIPLPDALRAACVAALQWGSAAVADIILKISGVAYARDGLCFYFSSISIIIADECSGIRSSSALIITSVVGARLFLATRTGKIALVVASIPLAMVKNGIRVATLALLAEKVNPHFITNSNLHHHGGFIFFGIALVLLIACLLLIERVERTRMHARKSPGALQKSGARREAAQGPEPPSP
ncbi:MAG TPA: exosortase/archaeosortase family protein [Chitinivibrionales bacterium]|nr:exosortase/archaeosortase family protein [Chitinivibrionales bacterium]